jgi:hypothetical protein
LLALDRAVKAPLKGHFPPAAGALLPSLLLLLLLDAIAAAPTGMGCGAAAGGVDCWLCPAAAAAAAEWLLPLLPPAAGVRGWMFIQRPATVWMVAPAQTSHKHHTNTDMCELSEPHQHRQLIHVPAFPRCEPVPRCCTPCFSKDTRLPAPQLAVCPSTCQRDMTC